MLPIPSPNAVALFIASAGMFVVAVAFHSPAAAVLSGTLLFGLALALTLTIPLGARLRRERLEFAWWHANALAAH